MNEKSSQELTRLRQIIQGISIRPCMYVNRFDVRTAAAYIDGFAMAAEAFEPQVGIWRNFQRWIEGQYGIFDSRWHWTDILLYVAGNHQDAIAAIPELFDQLIENGPLSNPEEWIEQRMLEKRGSSRMYAPEKNYDSESYPVLRSYPESPPPPESARTLAPYSGD